MIELIKKNYKAINIVFLFLSCYVILFPIVSIPIKSIFPQFEICPFLRLTGRNCPLCGGTRFIENIPQNLNNFMYFISPFGFMILFIIFEFFFRIYNLIKKKDSLKLIKIDLCLHIIVTILFFMYEILFFII